jgi:nitrogen fixation/metabolism regulation signal transduction histidine kinase
MGVGGTLELRAALDSPGPARAGDLLDHLAHGINTPLGTIALCAERLLRWCEEPAGPANAMLREFPRHLRTIGNEVYRTQRLVQALHAAGRSASAGAPARAALFGDPG